MIDEATGHNEATGDDEGTGYQVVIVRGADGEVIHTHEVVYFDEAKMLGQEELVAEALGAARDAHPGQGQELLPTVSSREELTSIVGESRKRSQKAAAE
jgi:hypothetical protein